LGNQSSLAFSGICGATLGWWMLSIGHFESKRS